MAVNLKEYIHPEMDILFVALNAPVNSNNNGHWFTNNLSFWNVLYRTGIITQPIQNKLEGDEMVFGSTSINHDNRSIGVTDLIRNVVETDSSLVEPSGSDVNRILNILKENRVRKLCLMHSKVGVAFRLYSNNISFNGNRYGKIGNWKETEIYEVPFHNASVANKDDYYALLANSKSSPKAPNEVTSRIIVNSKSSKSQIVKDGKSFVIPKPGNSITEKDIAKGQLRITVDFKDFFPKQSIEINIKYLGSNHTVHYTFNDRRSSILKVGNNFMEKLNISSRSRIQIRFVGGKYLLEKI